MRVCVLASGSKGNSTYIENENTKILIDFGMSCNYIEKNLSELNVNPKEIDGIFITHTHIDHIYGLEVFCKKYNTKVFISPSMKEFVKSNNVEFFKKELKFLDFEFKIIKNSHDIESYGFIINDKLVYITDTGYINNKYFEMIKNKKLYLIESNYENEMLIDGRYPHHLKQRIWSDKGHLSNNDCCYYLSELIDKSTKHIFLMHLSEENNTEEKVLENIKVYKNIKCNVIITKQKEKTIVVEI